MHAYDYFKANLHWQKMTFIAVMPSKPFWIWIEIELLIDLVSIKKEAWNSNWKSTDSDIDIHDLHTNTDTH